MRRRIDDFHMQQRRQKNHMQLHVKLPSLDSGGKIRDFLVEVLAVLELLQLEVVEVEVLELLDTNKEHNKDEGRAARAA